MAEPARTPPVPVTPHKQALYDAAVEVVRRQAEDRAAERAQDERRHARAPLRSPVVVVGLLVSIAACAYVQLGHPEWLSRPRPPAESPEVREASLRIGLASLAQRIEWFRTAHGRLPRSLAETGVNAADISYEPLDGGGYALRGRNGPIALTLRSTDTLQRFVGRSFDVLAARAHR